MRSSQLEVESRRRLAYWKKDKHSVGLEKDVELLLEKVIFEKREGLFVAAIVGMGGIGKSTLASKIYNHPAIADRFKLRAWVVVSSEFTPEDIMKQILLQLDISLDDLKLLESVNDDLGRRENLKKELHKRLTGKRYFIVLDDVWEAKHWESLSSAFPDEDKAGSRLFVTSRHRVMTKYNAYEHNMKVLDGNESWELFLMKAMVDNTNGRFPEELKNTGERILKKCGGLPLAISMVGGPLAKMTRCKSEWEKLLKEMKSHFDRSGDINTVSAVLELSYQNLPPELKACFLCLGFFKEDAFIKAKDLVHIWVSLGLVPQEVVGEGETMEDVARGYLSELISRNMVQVKEMKYDEANVFHIHDLLRDLSIRKAKEELDLEEVKEEGISHQPLDKPRHRAIYCSGLNFVYSTRRNQYVRSLFIHCGETPGTDGGLSSYWKSYELLRVVDLGNEILQVLPTAIGVLTGLRYFKMRYEGGDSRLPRSWGKLKNLEVLDLRGVDMIIMIDKVVGKMDSLRYLYTYIYDSEVSLGSIRNLHTMRLMRVRDSSLWQIKGMTNVSDLSFDMSVLTNASRLFTNLATLGNLMCLTLRYYEKGVNMDGIGSLHHLTKLKMDRFCINRLPDNFPPNLSYLSMYNFWLTEDPMPVLEKLTKLLHLKLRSVYKGEGPMVISHHGFPSLRILHLEFFSKMRNIEIEEGAMPELNQFIIRHCPELKIDNLPEHLKHAIIHERTIHPYSIR